MTQTHLIVYANDLEAIKCLVCGMTSYHPKDVEFLYCGKCFKHHPIRDPDVVRTKRVALERLHYSLDRLVAMNCINCGSPSKTGRCLYCGTGTTEHVEAADKIGFMTLRKMVSDFEFDSDRVKAVATFRKVGADDEVRKKLTAGQIRVILDLFAFDSDRVRAAAHLIPLSTSRVQLLEIGDVFTFDSDRAFFFDMVASNADYSSVLPARAPFKPPETSTSTAGYFILALFILFTLALWGL